MRVGVRGMVLATACMVALTGCVKLDADLRVRADETVSGSMLFGVDKRLAMSTGQSLEQMRAQIERQLTATSGNGVTCSRFEDDTYVGSDCRLVAVPFSELRGGGIDLRREGERFVFSAGGGQPPEIPPGLARAEIRFRITMPGRILENDRGAKVDGRTATYTDMRSMTAMRLVSEAGEDVPLWAIAVLAAGIVAGACALVLLVRSTGRGGGAAQAPAWPGPSRQ